MDDLDNSPADTHLSYPVASGSQDPAPPPVPQSRQLLKDRLFVGNLSPTVDESVPLNSSRCSHRLNDYPDTLFYKSSRSMARSRSWTSSFTRPALRKANRGDMLLWNTLTKTYVSFVVELRLLCSSRVSLCIQHAC